MSHETPTLRSVRQRLERLIDYERHPPMAPTTRVFHLDEFQSFLTHLGDPQRESGVIHIAGTKGKGTVATLLAEALHHRGHRVGLYRSPHVDNLRERITVDGQWISPRSFARHCTHALDVHERTAKAPDETFRTYFEILTATAFLHFKIRRVDWAVIETGLGGRLDATNVVEPNLTILTAIGIDHTRVLGTDPVAIAKEKAGILKPGIPCVLGPQPKGQPRSVRDAINARAKRLGCALIDASRRWTASAVALSPSGLRADLVRTRKIGDSVKVTMPYPSLASVPALVTVWSALDSLGMTTRISKGTEKFQWINPGRFEVVTKRPLTVLDGAHCPLSAQNLNENIERIGAAPRRLCLAMMSDKKPADYLRAFNLQPDDAIALPRISTPRQLPPEELAGVVKDLAPGCSVEVFDSVRAAICWLGTQRPKGIIVASGSFYHLSAARRALREMLD